MPDYLLVFGTAVVSFCAGMLFCYYGIVRFWR